MGLTDISKTSNIDGQFSVKDDFKSLKDSVCAIGVFDGFHLGHKFLINKTIQIAKEKNLNSAVITFDIDPDSYFNSDNFKKILDDQTRIDNLRSSGIDNVVVLNFDSKLSSLTPEDFLNILFSNNLPNTIIVGSDFRFGKFASGDVNTLAQWGVEHNVHVFPLELLQQNTEKVSSTRIRNLIKSGQVDKANELLGYDFVISGKVVHGRHMGSSIGFPTANIRLKNKIVAPSDGVYAGIVLLNGKEYKAAISIGKPPTLESAQNSYLEAFILDFDDDIYDETIFVVPLKPLRKMQKFSSLDDLKEAIKNDVEQVRLVI